MRGCVQEAPWATAGAVPRDLPPLRDCHQCSIVLSDVVDRPPAKRGAVMCRLPCDDNLAVPTLRRPVREDGGSTHACEVPSTLSPPPGS